MEGFGNLTQNVTVREGGGANLTRDHIKQCILTFEIKFAGKGNFLSAKK
jgi:hypothetical protein